jgi:cytochrome c-type biogenesis protein CcmH
LRKIVRQHVVAGESEAQITAWMVARYGDFVRLKPPLNVTTLLLWGSPLVALLIGALTVLGLRRSNTTPPPPLSEAEQRRLSSLMEP